MNFQQADVVAVRLFELAMQGRIKQVNINII
jgi:hypothetical protein